MIKIIQDNRPHSNKNEISSIYACVVKKDSRDLLEHWRFKCTSGTEKHMILRLRYILFGWSRNRIGQERRMRNSEDMRYCKYDEEQKIKFNPTLSNEQLLIILRLTIL